MPRERTRHERIPTSANERIAQDSATPFSVRVPAEQVNETALPLTAPTIGHSFSQIRVHAAPIAPQPKLAVNAPGDAFEQEADRVANEVINQTEEADTKDKGSALSQESERFQAKPATSGPPIAPKSEIVAQRGNGQPLGKSARTFAEPHFGHNFSQIRVHAAAPAGPLQPKLTVNQPGDVYEQEADQVAEQVMGMADPNISIEMPTVAAGPCLQRCTRCGGERDTAQVSAQGICAACAATETHAQIGNQVEEQIQAKEILGNTPVVTPGIQTQIDAMRGGGQPLDPATRAFMEPRFGHDFSQVRLHTDTRAVEAARSVNALAFTVGNDIAFGAGHYQPGGDIGRRLLAHELTHVVQQTTPATLQRQEDEGEGGDSDSASSVETENIEEIGSSVISMYSSEDTSTDQASTSAESEDPEAQPVAAKVADHTSRITTHPVIPSNHPSEQEAEAVSQAIVSPHAKPLQQMPGIYRVNTSFDVRPSFRPLTFMIHQRTSNIPLVQTKPQPKQQTPKKLKSMKLFVDDDLLVLELVGAPSVTVRTSYNGKPKPGTYTFVQEGDAFRLVNRTGGTVNEQGAIITWSQPSYVTFAGVKSYTLTVVSGKLDGSATKGKSKTKGNSSKTTQNDILSALKALPDNIKELLGGEDSFKTEDYEQLLRIAKKLQSLTPEDLEYYKHIATELTKDLNKFEKSIDIYIEAKAKIKSQAQIAAQKQSKEPTLQEKLAKTEEGFDKNTFSTLNSTQKEAFARELASKQRNIQLEHMVTHPGETAVGMAEGLVRPDQVAKGITDDLKEAANGDASGFARAAGAVGAIGKYEGYIAGVAGALCAIVYVALLFVPGVNALELALTALSAIALGGGVAAIAFTGAEAELRIQAAKESTDPQEYLAEIEKSATAQANVVAQGAMVGFHVALKLIARIPLGERLQDVGTAIKMTRDATLRKMGAGAILDLIELNKVKSELIGNIRKARNGLPEALAEQSKQFSTMTDRVRGMTGEELLKQLAAGDKELQQATGITQEMATEYQRNPKASAKQIHESILQAMEEAPAQADKMLAGYLADFEQTIKAVQAASSADDLIKVLDNASERFSPAKITERTFADKAAHVKDKLQQALAEAKPVDAEATPKSADEVTPKTTKESAPKTAGAESAPKSADESIPTTTDELMPDPNTWKDVGLRDQVQKILARTDLDPNIVKKIKATLVAIDNARKAQDVVKQIRINKKALTKLIGELASLDPARVGEPLGELEHAVNVRGESNVNPETAVHVSVKYGEQLPGSNLPEIDIPKVEADVYYQTADKVIHLDEVKNTPNAFVEKLNADRQFTRYGEWIEKGRVKGQNREVGIYIRQTGPKFHAILEQIVIDQLERTAVGNQKTRFIKIGEHRFNMSEFKQLYKDALDALRIKKSENPSLSFKALSDRYFGTLEDAIETIRSTNTKTKGVQ